MNRIDEAMRQQRDAIAAVDDKFGRQFQSDVLRGVQTRQATERALYARQVDIDKQVLDELMATLTLLSAQPRLQTRADGKLLFQSISTADDYNVHLAKLGALDTEQQKLDTDIRQTAAKLANFEWWNID